MRIIKFTAENVKKLRAVEITPEGHVVEVVGLNGQGKSSVLDAIFYALGGSEGVPSQVIRNDEEKAFVKLELGDNKVTELIVTRHFTAEGVTRLTVESRDGARFPSPQGLLDTLVGALSFDPLAFTRMRSAEQLRELRKVVKLDADLDALDAEIQKNFEIRTATNREVKALESRLQALPVVPESTPDTPVDVSALAQRLQDANTHAANREKIVSKVANLRVDALYYREKASQLQQELEGKIRMLTEEYNRRQEQCLEKVGEFNKEIEAKEAQLVVLGAPAPVADILAELKQAEATNERVRQKQAHAKIEYDLKIQREKADNKTAIIEFNSQRRRQVIAEAKMPVEGLTFGESGVIFNGLLLENASAAEQLRVSVALAVAANPRLRILRVKDGSLLDKNSLRLLAELAETQNFQLWLERVEESGDRPAIIMEDGRVKVEPHHDEHEVHRMETDGVQSHPDAQ